MKTTTRIDELLLILTALFVGGLAIVAEAISVDCLELVAILYLVAQRLAGLSTGRFCGSYSSSAPPRASPANIAVDSARSDHSSHGRCGTGWICPVSPKPCEWRR
jgi:hypothetical protein